MKSRLSHPRSPRALISFRQLVLACAFLGTTPAIAQAPAPGEPANAEAAAVETTDAPKKQANNSPADAAAPEEGPTQASSDDADAKANSSEEVAAASISTTDAPTASPSAEGSAEQESAPVQPAPPHPDVLARLEELEMELELRNATEEENIDEEVFRLYGFMDMGLQRIWADENALVSALFDTNATTFVVGNIDLYFDFNPDPDWRGLAEIRFSNAPHGNITNFGGLGGEFERTDTQQYDPAGTAINAPMWGGFTVIERAWIEWKKYEKLRIRTGNFFTPFGIWNVDHGQPTLIATALPQMLQQKMFPLRQTGVQALGSFFVKKWELGYRAWLTNGRQELSNFDFDDGKAYGARLLARKDTGFVKAQIGSSFHRGHVEDRIVDITTPPTETEEIGFESYSSWAYMETIIGVDVSVDVGKGRLRLEGLAQLREWNDGKQEPYGYASPVEGALKPTAWDFGLYGVLAHPLPWLGLEPYLAGELIQRHWQLADGLVVVAPGLNVHFSPSATLKMQVSHGIFFKWLYDDFKGDVGSNDTTSAIGRLVLAF